MTTPSTTVEDVIRGVLARVPSSAVDTGSLGDTDDLFDAGLTSHASVQVMLGLEDEFDVEFPPEMLRKSTFSSVRSIAEALSVLGAGS